MLDLAKGPGEKFEGSFFNLLISCPPPPEMSTAAAPKDPSPETSLSAAPKAIVGVFEVVEGIDRNAAKALKRSSDCC